MEQEENVTLTTSQEQAVKKAKSYIDFFAFSRNGLIEQLEFEGFTKEDSTYAVDYLKIDWKEQAEKKKEDSHI